jgi:uncharacterized protein (TIGR00255 family)
MKSMTGYGLAERQDERFQISVEFKSYNNRYFDLSLNLPPALGPLEANIRDTVRERVVRGRVECYIRFRDNQENLQISLDSANVLAYKKVLDELRSLGQIVEPVGLQHLLSVEGLVRVDRQRDLELYWQAIEPVLATALDALDQSRQREGAALLADLLAQMGRIEEQVAVIEAATPRIEAHIRSSLRQRFVEVLGDQIEEQRFLSEIAVQLMRYTVNEELVRLHAHLEAARALMTGQAASGKKMDFLCQEMNREINTIGSKNIILEIGGAVIETKDALENIREQIRNAE